MGRNGGHGAECAVHTLRLLMLNHFFVRLIPKINLLATNRFIANTAEARSNTGMKRNDRT
jgi:hypothetical protein